jgi:hypothetical protein
MACGRASVTGAIAAARMIDLSGQNVHVAIGGQSYYLSADGFLMPTQRDQAPPDFRFFRQPSK